MWSARSAGHNVARHHGQRDEHSLDKVHSKRKGFCLKLQSEGYTKDNPPPLPPPIDYTKRIYHLLVGVLVANVVGYLILAMQINGATP